MAYSEKSTISFNAPFFIGCLFGTDEELESKQREEAARIIAEHGEGAAAVYGKPNPCDYNKDLYYETRTYQLLESTLQLRQFDDHPTNANCVWPEAAFLAEWLTGVGVEDNTIINQTPEQERINIQTSVGTAELNFSRLSHLLIEPDAFTQPGRSQKKVLELGSATGALAIYLRKHGVDITSSDLSDPVVTDNIAYNCSLNGQKSSHLVHSWGKQLESLEESLESTGYYDILLGSDILAYEDSFPDLADTLSILIPPWNISCILYMVWKRRHKRKTENIFFDLLKQRGFSVQMNRQRVYTIRREIPVVPLNGHLNSLPEEFSPFPEEFPPHLVGVTWSPAQDEIMEKFLSCPETMKYLTHLRTFPWSPASVAQRRENQFLEQQKGNRYQFSIVLRNPEEEKSVKEKGNLEALNYQMPGDEFIGIAGLMNMQFSPISIAEYGVAVDHRQQRRGFGLRLAYRIHDYGFRVLKLRTIKCATQHDNVVYQSMMENGLGVPRKSSATRPQTLDNGLVVHWVDYEIHYKDWPKIAERIKEKMKEKNLKKQ